MFKLIGSEKFTIGQSKTSCEIKIEPHGSLSYKYSLDVGGKPYKTFIEKQSKVMTVRILILFVCEVQ